MAVAVADVLIAFLGREDANHTDAVERMRRALEPGTRRLVSAVNYTEVLIGPLAAAGPPGAKTVDAMLVRLGIETVQLNMALAQRAAAVRVRTKLKLPDAYAVATAVRAENRGPGDVRLETFNKNVVKAYEELHPAAS